MSTIIGYLIGQVGQLSGARFAIPESGLIIGRDPNHAGLFVEDSLVSRQHAKIAPAKDGKLYLIDLQSRNGTSLNGKKVTTPVTLSAGDKIELGAEGKVIFIFESADTTSLSGVLKEAFGETVAPVEWKAGDNILGIYEVTGILGQGGMGRVYKVHHKSWNMDLAVKSPLPGHFTDKKAVASFVREAETWSNLNLHPNIVQCYYVRTIGGIPRIFAEYVPGGTLGSWIKNRKLTQLDQILDVAIQFAWGLHAAHEQGIVHQDIKPANVLMTEDGSPKVTDFGLARSRPVSTGIIPSDQSALVSFAGGTPAYCSPEQARGKKLSRKTDIWSWAATVLHMFIGNIVWQSGLQTPRVLKNYRKLFGPKFLVRMPKRVAKLLESCLSGRVEDRPKDMSEIANEMRAIYQQACDKPYPHIEPKAAEHLADSLNNRAVSLSDLGKKEEAIALWEKALQLHPNHLESVYNRGLAMWRSARMTDDTLIQNLTEIKSVRHGEWLPDYLLALVHCERGDFASAEQLLFSEVMETATSREEVTEARDYARGRIADSRHLLRVFDEGPREIRCFAISADGQMVLIASDDMGLGLWEVSSGRRALEFQNYAKPVTTVCLSPDSRCAVSLSKTHTIDVWETDTGKRTRILEGHEGVVSSVRFSSDGRYLLSGSEDSKVRLWDVVSGKCVRVYLGNVSGILSVSLSINGHRAASVSRDGLLTVWDVASAKCVTTIELEAYAGFVLLAADGSHAVTGAPVANYGSGGLGKLWNIGSGQCVRVLDIKGMLQRSVYHGVSFSGDFRLAMTGTDDGTLRLFDVGTGRCIWTYHLTGTEERRNAVVDPVERTFSRHLQACVTNDARYALFCEWNVPLSILFLGGGNVEFRSPAVLSRTLKSDKAALVQSEYKLALRHASIALENNDPLTARKWIQEARALPGYTRKSDAIEVWSKLYTRLPRTAFCDCWEDFRISDLITSPPALSGNGRYLIYCVSTVGEGCDVWDVWTKQRAYKIRHESICNDCCALSADGSLALTVSLDYSIT